MTASSQSSIVVVVIELITNRQSSVTEDVDLTQTTNTRVIMKNLPQAEKEMIDQEVSRS